MRAVEALQEYGRQCGVGERELFRLALVLEECASNIVNHALGPDERSTFHVTFEISDRSFVLELRDRGTAFDPTTASLSKSARPGTADPSGGWGLQLVRRYTDEVRYTREADENVLRLTKHLIEPPAQI
jgi:anti-sigma regulatory factor (Ser/Thr protein kinase)